MGLASFGKISQPDFLIPEIQVHYFCFILEKISQPDFPIVQIIAFRRLSCFYYHIRDGRQSHY